MPKREFILAEPGTSIRFKIASYDDPGREPLFSFDAPVVAWGVHAKLRRPICPMVPDWRGELIELREFVAEIDMTLREKLGTWPTHLLFNGIEFALDVEAGFPENLINGKEP